jgi:dihydroorotate dehydrogenase (NAD+) catalytic subunit
MIELAPRHKIGLPLRNPILIGSGFGGYGEAGPRPIPLSLFGALVTGPITLRPERGAPQPRMVETPHGFILTTGQQNPGVKKILHDYTPWWQRLGTPVIAHLPAADPDDLQRTARALAANTPLAALELGAPDEAWPEEVWRWVSAIRDGSELPLLVKLPLAGPPELAEAAMEAGADALVVGAAPLGAAFTPDRTHLVSGPLYGPAVHNLALARLQATAARLDIPCVAAGGIHTLAQVEDFLRAGAVAVQLDALLWVEPEQAEAIIINYQ